MKEAQRKAAGALLAKAARTLEAAQSVIENGFFDDASSRAYYTAFHAASAALAGRGLFFSSHGQVMGAFNREFVKTGLCPVEAFQKIRRLFQDRHTGDYDASRSLDEETGRRAVEDAAWLVDECRRLIENG